MWERMSKADKLRVARALAKEGSERSNECRDIANEYGVTYKTVLEKWKNKIRDEGVEDAQLFVKGRSTLVDEEGNVKLQWIKEDTNEKLRIETLMNSIEKFIGSIEPRAEILLDTRDSRYSSDSRDNSRDDILVKYPIADAHIGLLTWGKEVGVDWDIKIATEKFRRVFQMVVDSSPNSSECLILDLGDMMHTDDSSNQTKTSGHKLDVDGRFDKVFDAVLAVTTSMIDIALEKHERVIFRKTRGNHDGDISVAIGAFLEAYYRNNSRVTIERSPSLFWWYQFGKTLHYSTHGHTVKQKELGEVVAADCRSIWSEVDFVYCDTGHVHHQQILELRTCVCESHNSLVAGDVYNYGHGYRSGRNLKSIIYHREFGEIGRNVIDIKRIKDMQ